MHRFLLAGPVAAVTAAVLLAGCTSADDEPDDASTSAGRSGDLAADPSRSDPAAADPDQGRPTPVDVPAEVAEAATESADDYAAAVADALGDPEDLDGLADLPLEGVALDALTAQAEEYERSGWHITGRPRVVSVEVYEQTDDEMVIGACIDESRVKVRDQRGRVVSDGADRPRSLNIFTLSRRGSGWVVVDSTFPSDPDC